MRNSRNIREQRIRPGPVTKTEYGMKWDKQREACRVLMKRVCSNILCFKQSDSVHFDVHLEIFQLLCVRNKFNKVNGNMEKQLCLMTHIKMKLLTLWFQEMINQYKWDVLQASLLSSVEYYKVKGNMDWVSILTSYFSLLY